MHADRKLGSERGEELEAAVASDRAAPLPPQAEED